MGKRSLPIAEKRPTLETARQKLGGAARDDAPANRRFTPGQLVAFGEHTGVVVFAGQKELHVMIDPTKLRRISVDLASAASLELSAELSRIADDARIFETLVEGQPVRYADHGDTFHAGKLFEKCRYGGLVARDDGAVVAVGFRKLWPAQGTGAA